MSNTTSSNGYYSLNTATGIITNSTISGTFQSWPSFPVDTGFAEEMVTEAQITGKPLWVGNLSISSHIGRYHVAVFLRLNPAIRTIRIGTSDKGNAITVSNVAFECESDWHTFNDWVEARERLWGGRANLYSYHFPTLPSELGPTTNVRNHSKVEGHLIDVAVWVGENCIGEVYMAGDHFVFTHKDDAMLYVMKFTGSELTKSSE